MQEDEDYSGPSERYPPRPRFQGGRVIVLAAIALVVGYMAAGRLLPMLRERRDAVLDFDTMNTYGVITVPRDSGSPEDPEVLAKIAREAVERVNDLMSPFGEVSDIRRLNETPAGRWVEVDPATWTVVLEAMRWHRLSDGAFDPTIGPIKRLFRFDQGELAAWPDPGELSRAQARVGAHKLLFDREGMRLSWAVDGMRLDLGAIAKGYAADMAAEVLRRHGVRNALVDIGGELRVLGTKPGNPPGPWRVGIRGPRGEGVLDRLELTDAAVATSGDYERFFTYQGKRYEHIIDPTRGLPVVNDVASVTVIHPSSCLAADALATTLCVLGPEGTAAFLDEQGLGLFSGGVRAIMLVRDGAGGFERIEFTVDAAGSLAIVREAVES